VTSSDLQACAFARALPDPVEDALVDALRAATQAGQWEAVAALAEALKSRRSDSPSS
jgi:hypothetical protein